VLKLLLVCIYYSTAQVLDPGSCVASGLGIVSATAGSSASFLVKSFDTNGLPMNRGGDMLQAISSRATHISVQDFNNGVYHVDYTAPQEAFPVDMEVSFRGYHIRNSPFTIEIYPGPARSVRSTLEGDLVDGTTIGVTNTKLSLRVQTRDQYGNRLLVGGSKVHVSLLNSDHDKVEALVRDNEDGQYIAEFILEEPGTWEVVSMVDGVLLTTHLTLHIRPRQHGLPTFIAQLLGTIAIGVMAVVLGSAALRLYHRNKEQKNAESQFRMRMKGGPKFRFVESQPLGVGGGTNDGYLDDDDDEQVFG